MVNSFNIIKFLLFSSALIIFCSCKKEENTSIPKIEFISPGANQLFQASDTIQVDANISDDQTISFVKMNLTNANFIATGGYKSWVPGQPSFKLSASLILESNLTSGDYYILIRAENNDNYKNKYLKIHVEEIIPEFQRLIVLTGSGNDVITVQSTRDYAQVEPLFDLSGDYADSEMDNRNGILYIAGKNNLNLEAYDLSENVLLWKKELIPGKPMHNNNCLSLDQLLYTSFNYDFILGYAVSGDIGFNVSIEDSHAPYAIIRQDEFIITEVRRKNNGEPFLMVNFALTGAEKQRLFIDFEVVDFLNGDNNEIIIISNRNNTGFLASYDISTNTIDPILESEKFTGGCYAVPGTLIIASENKIYECSLENGSLVTLLPTGAQKIHFDSIENLLYVINNNELAIYDYPQMVNQKTLLLSDPILCVHSDYSW